MYTPADTAKRCAGELLLRQLADQSALAFVLLILHSINRIRIYSTAMDVQTIFYFLGSIFMLLGIGFLITAFILLFIVVNIAKKTGKHVEDILDRVAENTKKSPVNYMASTGMYLISSLIHKMRNRSSE